MERSHGTFQRSLRLPFAVDPGQVQTRFEHGVLRVTLPKTAAKQRSQRIEVRTGSSAAGAAQQPRIQPGDDRPAGDRPAGQPAPGGQQPGGPDIRH